MLERKAESRLLLALAAIQFVYIADFMVLSPLGPVLMRTFDVEPREFGLLISASTFSAAVCGLVGALFVDRFDRRRVLLVLFALFIVALIGASVAPGYRTLLAARVLGGGAGGLMGAIVYTVIGDQIPEERRGEATGNVMTAFALATVAGVPIGLVFSGWFGWHAPFMFMAGVAAVVYAFAWRAVPPMSAHVKRRDPEVHPVKAALWPVVATLRHPNHLRAFGFVVLLMFSAFMVIPFIALYNTINVGVTERQLPVMYLLGGAATLFTSRIVGRLADRFGAKRTYRAIAIASIVPILVLTHLPEVPFWVALLVSVSMFVVVPSRMIPAMAIVTSSAVPRLRGTFMSLNASIQSLSQAAASFAAGAIIVRDPAGRLEHFDRVGWLAVLATVAAIVWVEWIRSGQEARD
jgi:predicted MFS family arabinose efflux permease